MKSQLLRLTLPFKYKKRVNRLKFCGHISFWTFLAAGSLFYLPQGSGLPLPGTFISGFCAVTVLVISQLFTIGLVVNRLHDVNLRGWWSLLFLTSAILFAISFVLMIIKRGSLSNNRFGPVPKSIPIFDGLLIIFFPTFLYLFSIFSSKYPGTLS